jgi:hypothetical protein
MKPRLAIPGWWERDIIETVKTSRTISRKTVVMLANFYGLPKGDIRCLNGASSPEAGPY